jgi:hypothetical protein
MGSRWKGIAGPAIGLSAVTAALAIIAGAPIVLFPEKNDLEAIPAPPAGSSEVAQVTASLPEGLAPNAPPGGSAELTTPGAQGSVSVVLGPGSGVLAPPQPPLVRSPGGDGGDGSADKGGKSHGKGKAKGHDKSHGKGKAKGHDKWHGDDTQGNQGKKHSPSVASSPHGTKHGHGAHSGTGKHSGGGDRSHARSRG